MDNRPSAERRILVSGSVNAMTKSDPHRADLQHPIVTDLDLDRLWRTLMGPLGFGSRKLWLMFLDIDQLPVTQLTQIDEIPYEVDPAQCQSLLEVCRLLLLDTVPGGSVAILFSRPGRNPMTQADRQLARALTRAARDAGVALRPIHFANDVTLSVFALDDLLPTAGPAG